MVTAPSTQPARSARWVRAMTAVVAMLVTLTLGVAGLSLPAQAAELPSATPTGTTLTGRVTDAITGDPIADVLVTASQPEMADPSATRTATTDADGRYLIGDLESTFYGISFRKPGSAYLAETAQGGHSLENWEFVDIPLGGTLTLDAQLDKGAVASGVVTTSDGTPLPGVWISYYGYSNTVSGNDGVATDASGAWSLAVVPDLDLWISAFDQVGPYLTDQWLESDGSSPRLAPGEVRTDIDFHLVAGGTVSGRLVDGSGTPMAGVCASLVPLEGDGPTSARGVRPPMALSRRVALQPATTTSSSPGSGCRSSTTPRRSPSTSRRRSASSPRVTQPSVMRRSCGAAASQVPSRMVRGTRCRGAFRHTGTARRTARTQRALARTAATRSRVWRRAAIGSRRPASMARGT